jgi:hypothetical protein
MVLRTVTEDAVLQDRNTGGGERRAAMYQRASEHVGWFIKQEKL